MDDIKLIKLQVASRQLDSGIGLLLAGGDIVAAHTLAGAASAILAGVEPESDRSTQQVSGGEATYRNVARMAQELLRNANPDPNVTRELTPLDTMALMAATTSALYERAGAVTVPQSVFHLWVLACHFEALDESFEHREMIKVELGNLSRRTWQYQIAMGRVALEKAIAVTTATAA